MTAVARPLPMPSARDPAPVTMATLPLRRSSLWMSVIASRVRSSAIGPDGTRAEINLPVASSPRLARLEHALQRRLCNLGEGSRDLGLFRCGHPVVLDGGNAGFADAAQQRVAKVRVFDGSHRVIMQAAANGFGMRPAVDHMRR